MMHLSDSLRSALLYKNGGFYSDMDAITLKDLRFIHAIFYYSIFLVSNWNNDDKKVVTWLSSIYHLAKFASILYEFPRKWDTFSISYKTVWSKEYHMNEKMVPVSTKQSSVLRTPMVTVVGEVSFYCARGKPHCGSISMDQMRKEVASFKIIVNFKL